MKKIFLLSLLMVLFACGQDTATLASQVGVGDTANIPSHGHSGPLDGGILYPSKSYLSFFTTTSLNSAPSITVKTGDIYISICQAFINYSSLPTTMNLGFTSTGTASLDFGSSASTGLSAINSASAGASITSVVKVLTGGTSIAGCTIGVAGGTGVTYQNTLQTLFLLKQ